MALSWRTVFCAATLGKYASNPRMNNTRTKRCKRDLNIKQGHRHMSQSLSKIWIHVVFSTKHRKTFLKDPSVRKQLHDYLISLCNQQNSPALIVGGVEDHVHLLINLHKN